jgi:antibiotic biosynthesis monooxygenase (ABM) superfamily enzyme
VSDPGIGAPIFTVFLRVDDEVEAAWNRWYDEVHVPEVMSASPGIVSATRYRLDEGTVDYPYLAVYSFADHDSLAAFMASPRLREMNVEYDAEWGKNTSRMRGAYSPILHRSTERSIT